jgi:hypothetical protein
MAKRIQTHLESAYEELSLDLYWSVQEPIQVVIRDDRDRANAQAEVFPYNRLIFNAVPPQAFSTFGEYDDWLKFLVVHELTHILSQDTTLGAFATLRTIFGSVAKINPYQPLWLSEGLAVWYETQKTTVGRGRSVFSDMMVRALLLEGRLYEEGIRPPDLYGMSLDRLNQGPPIWPGGHTPYFMGYLIHELLKERGGAQAPGILSYRSGARFPFLLNTTLQEALGLNYYSLWDSLVIRLRLAHQRDLQVLTPGFVPSRARALPGREELGFRMSSSPAVLMGRGKVAYIRDDFAQGTGLSLYDWVTEKHENLSEWLFGGGDRLSVSPSEGELIYSRFEEVDEYQMYSDLYLWDLSEGEQRGREIRLTYGFRASHPSVSENFRWNSSLEKIQSGSIVYVKNLSSGRQGLSVWNGRVETSLYEGGEFERLSYPTYGRGEFRDWILFQQKTNEKSDRLLAIHHSSGVLRVITPQVSLALRAQDLTPSWGLSGDILYSSSRGGIYQVYRIRRDSLRTLLRGQTLAHSPIERVSHVMTGAFHPVEIPGDSRSGFAMVYTALGMRLHRMEFSQVDLGPLPYRLESLEEKLQGTGERLPRVKWKAGKEREEWTLRQDLVATPSSQSLTTQETYEPWSTLKPRYWFPSIGRVPEGWQLGAETSSRDALEWWRYALVGLYDTRADFPLYAAQVVYDRYYPSWVFSRTQENQYLGFFQKSNRLNRTSAFVRVPWQRFEWSLGGQWLESRFLDDRVTSTGGLEARAAWGEKWASPASLDGRLGDRGHRLELQWNGIFLGPERFSAWTFRGEKKIRSPFSPDFVRWYGNVGLTGNERLGTYYFTGGGQGAIQQGQDFLLRGYRGGALYGRSLVTSNQEYVGRLKDYFEGRGTLPIWLERLKYRVFLDVGAAEWINETRSQFQHFLVGTGAHLLLDVDFLYRIPTTLAIGLDLGLSSKFQGEPQLVLGWLGRY